MSDLLLRLSPSGRPLSLSDTLSPPGTILGRRLDAIGEGFAEPLDGIEFGRTIRFDGTYELSLAAGQYDNLPIPDGIRNVEITPVGGNVTISGILVGGRGNPLHTGLNFKLRGTGGIVTFLNSSTSSTNGNRIVGAGNTAFSLTNPGDSVCIARFDGGLGRWQTVSRLLRPAAVNPSAINTFGPILCARRALTATGAAADDLVISTTPFPFPAVVYDALLQISTAVGGSSAQLRDQPGGAGNTLSSSMSTAATGTVRNNNTTITPVAAGGLFYLRRTNGNTVGAAILFFRALL